MELNVTRQMTQNETVNRHNCLFSTVSRQKDLDPPLTPSYKAHQLAFVIMSDFFKIIFSILNYCISKEKSAVMALLLLRAIK